MQPFLLKAIKRLPADDDVNLPVTVDLNGAVAIRAVGDSQKRPTELLLVDSTATGESTRFNTNRRYLHRAAKLGFHDICVYGAESPIVCHDDHRTYVWAVLGNEGVIRPTKCAICTSSRDAQSPQRNGTRSTTPPTGTGRLPKPKSCTTA